jgi:hypothetical protein
MRCHLVFGLLYERPNRGNQVEVFKVHREQREMKTIWMLTGVTADGQQECCEQLGELTPEEATSKATELLKTWSARPNLQQCWLFYEQDDGKGSGTMLWERPAKSI